MRRNGKSTRDTSPDRMVIGVDARCFSDLNCMQNGLAERALEELAGILRRSSEACWIFYGETLPGAALTPLLEFPDTEFRSLDEYEPGDVDLLHVPTPLVLSPGFDSPFRIFREERMTVVLHDLSPLRVGFAGLAEEEAYWVRLEQLGASDARILAPTREVADEITALLELDAERVEVLGEDRVPTDFERREPAGETGHPFLRIRGEETTREELRSTLPGWQRIRKVLGISGPSGNGVDGESPRVLTIWREMILDGAPSPSTPEEENERERDWSDVGCAPTAPPEDFIWPADRMEEGPGSCPPSPWVSR